ncbi:MAG: hypothetical protein J5586_03900 [Clostridia bacterium]|nr:hypothetical protein [Clostridia bacterium]
MKDLVKKVFRFTGIKNLFHSIKAFSAGLIQKESIYRWYKRLDRFPDTFLSGKGFPDLSPIQKREINDFWKKYGVRKVNYKWYRMYYGITGTVDPRFIPHSILATVAFPYYNDLAKAKTWADKNEFCRVLPSMRFPATIAQRINGRYYDEERHSYGSVITQEYVNKVFDKIRSYDQSCIIIKQTQMTNSGKGVKKAIVQSNEDLSRLLESLSSSNFIIQKTIVQHSFFNQFNPSSVNIIRVTTWRDANEVYAFAPCVRFGIKGSFTDITFVNGKEFLNVAPISDDGFVGEYYYTLAGEKNKLNLKDNKVPCWKELIDTVKKQHEMLDYFDVVAWDMTVDDDNNLICIEYNIQEPGSIVYQFAHGPMFGDKTEALLAFLAHDENRKRIPGKIRM